MIRRAEKKEEKKLEKTGTVNHSSTKRTSSSRRATRGRAPSIVSAFLSKISRIRGPTRSRERTLSIRGHVRCAPASNVRENLPSRSTTQRWPIGTWQLNCGRGFLFELRGNGHGTVA